MWGSTRGIHAPRDRLGEVAIDNELAAAGLCRSEPIPALLEAFNEVLAGSVERVTFHNPGNAFCVLRIKASGSTRLRELLSG